MTIAQRSRFIPFNIDKTQYYIDKVTNKTLSESEFNDLTTANYEKDKQRGYEDRMSGYYDKWYRHNRLDEGNAYDEGVRLAAKEIDCAESMYIIPCMS